MLYELSYENLLMYSSVLPSYDSSGKKEKEDNGKKKPGTFRADDPKNREQLMAFIRNNG